MNGELASLAAIASHGSEWLRAASPSPAPDLAISNSCFKFVRALRFDLGRGGFLRRSRTVEGTAAWLDALREGGADELLLVEGLPVGGDLAPQFASAFANSGDWGLLSLGTHHSMFWQVRWEVGAQGAPDNRIWDLRACGENVRTARPAALGVEHTAGELRTALEEAHAFASRLDEVSDWAPWFTKALALLDSPTPEPPYHADMLPNSASIERRQLAAAAIQGWVFGGMGSWNDQWPSDEGEQREYERVGSALYEAVQGAVVVATNGA